MLEKITDLYYSCQDSYCVWKAKKWVRYKTKGALQAVGDYLFSHALGIDTTLSEHWNFYMYEADEKIYGTFREFLIESGCPPEEEIAEELSKINRKIHLSKEQES